MRHVISIKHLLFLLCLAISLTACGGGSSGGETSGNIGGNANNDVPPVVEAEPVPESFTAMANELFTLSEDSEPMDISKMDINSDADDELTDSSNPDEETAFSGMMTDNAK